MPTFSIWAGDQVPKMTFARSKISCWVLKKSVLHKKIFLMFDSRNWICVCAHGCLRKNRPCRASCFHLQRMGVREPICVWWFSHFQSLWYVLHTVVDSFTKIFGVFSVPGDVCSFISWKSWLLFSCSSTLFYFWTSNTIPEDALH